MRLAITTLTVASSCQIASLSSAHAAASPWSGTWTLDRNRSVLTGQSIQIERVPSGYHFDFGAVKFDIGDDGKFYPTIPGRTTSIKPIGPLAWVRVHRSNGKDFERSILRISPDQQTLVIDSETVDPEGNTHKSQDVEQRVGAGEGLAGVCRSRTPGINVPMTVFLSVLDDGRIQIGTPEDGNFFVVTPNGPAAANQGPRATAGAKLLLRRISATEMRWTVMLGENPFQEGIDVLSATGELIETTWTEKFPRERQQAVYHRK